VVSIREPQELPFPLTPEEEAWFKQSDQSLPFLTTSYYAGLIDPNNPRDPLRVQAVPQLQETRTRPYESRDPLEERKHSPTPRLVHRYPDRALILITDVCVLHCRHCFRRDFTGGRRGLISDDELNGVVSYLHDHPEITELILSGGDPLVYGPQVLEPLLARLSFRNFTKRVATRIPVVDPEEITDDLVATLRRARPLWVITQFNHPREVTPISVDALARMVDAGLPVLNQAVLLRGVNDSVETLARLFRSLVAARVKPYYLFQGDLAAGTSHLRVPLPQGLALMRGLTQTLSGLATPIYAVDLPGGGGKVPIMPDFSLRVEDGWFVYEGPDGGEYRYPDEG
jgi:lysine 2,3-aminomutase